MGAWSHEPFGNDTAADWAYGLHDSEDLAYVEHALDAVLEAGDDYLDSDLATEAIAAVDVMARTLGRGFPSNAYSEAADSWIERVKPVLSPALRQKAMHALTRIGGDDSELNELWADSDHFAAWQQTLTVLRLAMHD
ncbi:DUF4259 domain-containing protein [Massilia sp. CF038]|uniref:DUF4259 domain-containing protein n=1 Tax=Massilia sp. CF038 TaxID=1881045 RepID=UPI00091BECA8|nr:DUF4259 domain-containing protein [Massilia sp. CF038]SHH70199.1 protein of unknown function [Massilia sp. CF038]